MTSRNLIEMKNISKTFGTSEETKIWALKNINLTIEKGEFTSLVGPSGSGKSTLLNIVSGLERPSGGAIFLGGHNIRELSSKELARIRRDHIGLIFQAYNLIPVLTVKENIEYVMLLQRADKEKRKKRVEEMLEMVNLSGFEKRYPPELSGGQQQRVAIARAMVGRPDLILADEPTANIDSKTGSALIDTMKDLNKVFQMTFVFSTHDPMIMEKANRLITLHDGEIVSDENRI